MDNEYRINTTSEGFNDLIYIGRPIELGNVIYTLSGEILNKPTRTSIQIGPERHIEDNLGRFINHNCSPTVKIIGNNLVALKNIRSGDSITFNYNDSEDIMSNPFKCNCCDKMIEGSHLV